VDEKQWLADRFEQHRPHLRAVAYRMLDSLTEADDAVQDFFSSARGATSTRSPTPNASAGSPRPSW
jgi:DNA-directed RNA polymerase specialized sigma24 family protein